MYLDEIKSTDALTKKVRQIRGSLKAIPYLKRSREGKQNELQIAELQRLEGTLPYFASDAKKETLRNKLAPYEKIVALNAKLDQVRRNLHV